MSVLPIQNANASTSDAKLKLSEHQKTISEKKKPAKEKTVVSASTTLQKQLDAITKKLEQGKRLSESELQITKKAMMESSAVQTGQSMYGTTTGNATGQKSFMTSGFDKTKSETITSVQDPGQGHESHQLAVILPPSKNVYVGTLTYSASEPVQYVALHGPLKEGEDKGQPIWTPDGKTKYALTFIDENKTSGGWYFAGNALALHTKHNTPFTATYNVAYAEVPPGTYSQGTAATGTVTSVQDPGQGHESHQLALILPPRDIPYEGAVLAYSASKNVQLVSLMGPLSDDKIHGQKIWTPDGKTKYALTIIDGSNMGIWTTFSGNALALHSPSPDPFTASYTVVGLH